MTGQYAWNQGLLPEIPLIRANVCETFTIMMGQDDPAVTIHRDGRIEVGEKYSADEAARAFWDAVRATCPLLLEPQ